MSVNSTLTLAEVGQAIKNILLGGQAVSSAGMTLTRGNLDELYKLRRVLMTEQQRTDGNGLTLPDFGGASGGIEATQWGDVRSVR